MKRNPIEKLNAVELENASPILFLGNGINRCFQGESWSDLITKLIKDTSLSYDLIKNLPFPMQVVIATKDDVGPSMKKMTDLMIKQEYSSRELDLYNRVFDLNISDILTTNYTYELEGALSGGLCNIKKNRWCQHTEICSKDKSDNRTRWLYRYSSCGEKRVWHIHGELSAPNHMVIGHYYYSKLSACINSYIPDLLKRISYCRKNDMEFVPKSWVDLFMISDVIMLGFGMDLSESDIWYLTCCKKRNFPKTKIYLFMPCRNGKPEKDIAFIKMLECYGVSVIYENQKGKDYLNFYNKCIDRIRDISKRKTL